MKYAIDDEEIETALRKYLNDNIEIEKKDIEPFLSFFLKSKQPVKLICEGEVKDYKMVGLNKYQIEFKNGLFMGHSRIEGKNLQIYVGEK